MVGFGGFGVPRFSVQKSQNLHPAAKESGKRSWARNVTKKVTEASENQRRRDDNKNNIFAFQGKPAERTVQRYRIRGAPLALTQGPKNVQKFFLEKRAWYQALRHVCAKARLRNLG